MPGPDRPPPGAPTPGHGRGIRAVLSVSLLTSFGSLPVFLLGPLGIFIGEDLGLSEAQLGVAIATYFAAAAVSSVPGGRVVERLGSPALAVGAFLSATALGGLATAQSAAAVLAWLVVGGAATAVSHLAANLRLAGEIDPSRQGVAFGIKQSAIPIATLAGGAAVPVFGVTVGWRWAYVTAAVAAAVFGAVQYVGARGGPPTARRRGERPPAPGLRYLPLVVLAVGTGFGAGAATALGSFVVGYAAAVGVDPAQAGMVLVVGSLAGICARVSMGWLTDVTRGSSLALVAGMLVAGATALSAMPMVTTVVPISAVTLFAYALGWGWPGLFNYAVVRSHRQAPAAATGVTQVGVYVGGVVGPLTFGVLVSRFGYATAWRVGAAAMLVAAVLMICGRALVRRRGPADSAVTGSQPSGRSATWH